MNNDISFDKPKFDAVWQRVMSAAPDTADYNTDMKTKNNHAITSDAELLRDFIDDEANDAHIYAKLASMCNGSARQMLQRISCDERQHLKKLRAYYFILTGETYTPPSACPLIYGVANTLRSKHIGEQEGSAAYMTAANNTTNPDLADTYRRLSEDEARHSRIIGCIIEKIL